MKINDKILVLLFTACFLLFTIGQINAQDSDASKLFERARQAGIEQTSLAELKARAEEKAIDAEHLSQILNAALEMSAQDLPAEMAINKALEGFSKGVPSERIIPAVNEIQQSTFDAAKVVDPWVNKPEVREMVNRSESSRSDKQFRSEMVRAASTSFMQGMSADMVNKVLSEIGSESVLSNTNPANMVAAMGILSDLPTTGKQADISAKFIVRALKGGFSADELQKLPSALRVGQQRSQLPAASVVNQVISQMEGGIPAKQILQNLFNGNVGGPPGNIPKGLENRPDQGDNRNNNPPTG